MEWLVKGDIPKRINSKNPPSTSIDKIRFFNDLRTADYQGEIRNFLAPLLDGKCIAEITRHDADSFFVCDAAKVSLTKP